MVSTDVRQAAMVAIAKGWYLYSKGINPYQAELAIAVGLYTGSIQPTVQDDVTHGLKVIIHNLPVECDAFFIKAMVVCPFCQATTKGCVHIVSSSTTWLSDDWSNLSDEIYKAAPLLGNIAKGWHRPECMRDDYTFTIEKLGKWIFLEFRPSCALSSAQQTIFFLSSLIRRKSFLTLHCKVIPL